MFVMFQNPSLITLIITILIHMRISDGHDSTSLLISYELYQFNLILYSILIQFVVKKIL